MWMLLYKPGYIISVPLPWSTKTFFTSYPPIWRVTTRVSSWGWKVPTLSSSEKPKVRSASDLTFLDSQTCPSSSGFEATDITPGHEPALRVGVAKITLIVPKDGRVAISLWYPTLVWLTCPKGWCMNCFNFLAFTTWSRWSLKALQSSTVCPLSWWYQL